MQIASAGWKKSQARLDLLYEALLPASMSRLAGEILRGTTNAIAGPSRCLSKRVVHCTFGPPMGSHVLPRQMSSRKGRSFSSTAAPKTSISPVNPLQLPAFDSFISSISSTQPCFGARGDEVSLLTSPVEFKAAILDMVKRAKRRIIISSLYIGVEEDELVSLPFSDDGH